ncbi:hypothetical protein [Leptospira broomii]|uniref:hypothetical protein n=1 Tax=Leptospira broomii TaxID=301541 RepID=UPI000288D1FE|nr:hypothetical protein [Leptospira broomii]
MKNTSIYLLRVTLSLTLSVAVLFAFGSVRAESQCHGLSKGQCEADSDCTWVSGYHKQSGTNVDAYCRAKPGKAGEGDHADHHSKKKKDEDGDTVKKSESKKSHERDDEEKDSKKVKKPKKDKDEDGDKESKKSKKSKKDKDGDGDKKSKKSKKKGE